MPKAGKKFTQAEQSKRFIADATAMIDAGKLSPTDAEKGLDNVIENEGEKLRLKLTAKPVDESSDQTGQL